MVEKVKIFTENQGDDLEKIIKERDEFKNNYLGEIKKNKEIKLIIKINNKI